MLIVSKMKTTRRERVPSVWFFLLSFVEFLFEKLPCIAIVAAGDVLWCACCYDAATFFTSFWSEVDDVIGTFDDIHVVLDDDDCMSARYEGIEGIEKFVYVVEVEACGWFVENEHCGLRLLLAEVIGQFYALVLAS